MFYRLAPRCLALLYASCAFAGSGPVSRASLAKFWAPVAFVPQGTTGVTRTEVVPVVTESRPGTTPGTNVPVDPTPSSTGAPSRSGPAAAGASPPTAAGAGTPRVSTAQAECEVTLTAPGRPAPASGGVIEVHAVFEPPTCGRPQKTTAPWLRMNSVSAKEGKVVYSIAIDRNQSAAPRSTVFAVGSRAVTLRQEAAATTPFAVSPGRVAITVGKSAKPVKHTLTIWSEDANLNYTVIVDKAARDWIEANEELKKKGKTRKLPILIKPGKLEVGTYSGSILIRTERTVSAPITVPVFLTVKP